MASKYDVIWNLLKANKQVKVAIPVRIQKRVIKGVIHSKDHDLGRKLELTELRKKEKITYIQDGPMVTFNLNEYDNLKNLSLEEL